MIKIYTDGSCLNNPGNGGWAAIINDNGQILKISGSEKNTTNNKMELMAPIKALKKIDKNDKIEIYTDSKYLKLGITEWIHKWIKNKWQTSKKERVKNKDLWLELYELTNSVDIDWIWVKAHSGNPLNEEVDSMAKKAAESTKVGDPFAEDTGMGPVVSEVQFDKIQGLIEKGIEEGAELVAGGPGKPEGLNAGYFVRPTVFANVNNDMTIAREEIFGPVLSILPYKDEEEAVEIANDTEYGLYGYVSSGDVEHAKKVANRIRAGSIAINGAGADFTTPFGGYKQSGNGREWGLFGFEEFLEVKAVVGFTS